MSTPEEFVFRLKLAGRSGPGLVKEVAAAVFRHVGCPSLVVADLMKELNAVILPRADNGLDVDVQFLTRAGACEVAVFVHDREIWRAVRPIP